MKMNIKKIFFENPIARVTLCILLAGCFLAAGIGIGYQRSGESYEKNRMYARLEFDPCVIDAYRFVPQRMREQ